MPRDLGKSSSVSAAECIETLGLVTGKPKYPQKTKNHHKLLILIYFLGLPVTHPNVSIHSAAETLLLFTESLREPVIPHSKYNHCIECSGNYLQCRQIVSQLPLHHREVFNYVCEFLREVLRYSAQNSSDPKILATLFASIMLRDPVNLGVGIKARAQQQLLENKKARFVYHFLVNETNIVPSE